MVRATSAALVLLFASQAAGQAPAPAQPAPAAPAPAPAPAAPAPAPSPAAPPAGAPAMPPGPPPPVTAPPGYYVEGQTPPPAPGTPPAGPPGVYEPPPPGFGPVYEPPPPPIARHVAPQTALWVGVRAGWFLPFGYLYARSVGRPAAFHRVPWSDYAGSGVMLEGDVGARLGRNYTVFALWERAQLTSGNAENDVFGGQSGGDSDFWAIGLDASSDADGIGLLTEIALGYRQFRATWEDGTELQFTDGILEARIGFGAEIRLSPMLSIAPMATIGVGSFGEIDRVFPDGASASVIRPGDAADSHAWFTLGVGAHADLFGTK